MIRFCLVALIGLPSVGKTRTCQYLMQMESLPFNIFHLCYDNLIKFNPENPTQYKGQRDNILKMLTELITSKNFPIELKAKEKIQYKDHQCDDIIILCDDNHYYRSMRYKLYQLAREHSTGYCQIYFKCCLKLALERNNLRCDATKVPNDVIVQMSNRFEVPNAIENKWEENSLTLDSPCLNEINCNKIISYILQFLETPVHPLQIPVSKSTSPQSKAHELDLLLRKRIKVLISSKQEENKKFLAKTLNNKRKEILQHFQMNLSDTFENDINLRKYVDMLNNF